MARIGLAAATEEVARRDPALAKLIARAGQITYRPRSADGPFAALVRAIVFQQLAGRAAQAILGRVVETVGGVVSPEALAAATDAQLRTAGLSGNKVAALRDLSAKVLGGEVNLSPSAKDSDESVIDSLIRVRGIGRWTAEMFLMFEQRRLDVWPVDDLGVRQGYALIWGLDPVPSARQLAPLGDPFRPYRSVVARYCWEAVALSRRTDTRLR
jgi:3-methyladenine DNA glycosylase/8-oxoguanine DNA glycosylase